MKKILTLIAMSLMISCSEQELNGSKNNDEVFVIIYQGEDYYVSYDKETKVMYRHNHRYCIMLVKQDGTPKLYNN